MFVIAFVLCGFFFLKLFKLNTEGQKYKENLTAKLQNSNQNFCLSSVSLSPAQFSFTDVKTMTIPAICSVNYSGLLGTINTVLVTKERFYASSALKNNLKANTSRICTHKISGV